MTRKKLGILILLFGLVALLVPDAIAAHGGRTYGPLGIIGRILFPRHAARRDAAMGYGDSSYAGGYMMVDSASSWSSSSTMPAPMAPAVCPPQTSSGVTVADIQAIREQVAMIRLEIMEVKKKLGMPITPPPAPAKVEVTPGSLDESPNGRYAAACQQALTLNKPLALWVGYKCVSSEKQLTGFVHCHLDACQDVQPGTVVVGVPHNGSLDRVDDVPASEVSAASIRLASLGRRAAVGLAVVSAGG